LSKKTRRILADQLFYGTEIVDTLTKVRDQNLAQDGSKTTRSAVAESDTAGLCNAARRRPAATSN
jgi:hypothetical protein